MTPRLSAWEVTGVIVGAASTTVGVLLSWNPEQDPRRADVGRAAELLGIGLLLGISTERVLRTFVAERTDAKSLANEGEENPTTRRRTTYDVAFKKRQSGRLKWIRVESHDEKEALRDARLFIATRYEGDGWRLYAGPLRASECCARYSRTPDLRGR